MVILPARPYFGDRRICCIAHRSSMAAALLAADEVEAWVDGLYGETSSEWRNLIAMNDRQRLAEALPPLVESGDLIYGEFDVARFLAIVAAAMREARPDGPVRVVDIGSGCGRLVLALARSRPDYAVAGLEFAPRLHEIGVRAVAASGLQNADLVRGDLHDPRAAGRVLARATLVFCYSTALASEGDDDIAARLSDALAAGLAPGALVVTTDRRLRDAAFDLVRVDRGLPGSITGATVDVYLSRRRA